MRCPNPDCRTVFTVPAHEPAPPPAKPQPPNGRHTGTVGDMIPLVEAEAVEAPAAPSWQHPPPVRRPTPTPAPAPAPEPPPAVNNGPREMAPGTWEPPPVRRGQPAAPAEAPAGLPMETAPAEAPAEQAAGDKELDIDYTGSVEGAVEAPKEDEELDIDFYSAVGEPIPHPPARRLALVVAAFALLVVAVLGGGAWLVWSIMHVSEGEMARQADDAYKGEQYSQAAVLYKQLGEQFPASDKHDSYLFMQGLSDLRYKAKALNPDIPEVTDAFFNFLSNNKEHNEDALKDHAPDLGETVVRLAEGYFARNPRPADETTPLHVMDRLQKAFDAAAALGLGDAGPPLKGRFAKADNSVRGGVRLLVLRNQSVNDLKKAMSVPSPSLAVRQFINRLKEEKRVLSDIDQDPEVVEMQKQVYAHHLAGVTYKERVENLPPARRENDEATFVVNPLLNGTPGKAPSGDPIRLALARGVLYALKSTNGDTKWAVRVGVDTTALPVRVPATAASPERILVPSADDESLSAFDADGKGLWTYRLGEKCLGRPLVIGNLAYVPTYDHKAKGEDGGKVYVIELAQGKLTGVYDLGQPLTCGGVRQPGTNLLYFPADDFCVYVLDVQQQRCVNVLYTGHPAGSLRGEPLVLTPNPAANESWLVLNEALGLHETEMHVYHLPLQDREQPPEKLDPPPVVPGWTWFPPAHDDEKVAVIGDTGVLGLFGIRQMRNQNDPPLFPLLPSFHVAAAAKAGDGGRSEVVEMQDQDLCVLARGRLERLSLELNAAAGPRLEPAAPWHAPDLGSPLHASQVETHPLGGNMLYLVTQPLRQQTCLATAVDDKEGDVLWQRQLGMVCQGEPLELRPPGGTGAPILLTLDRGGGLFAFDPAKHADLKDGDWRDGGKSLFPALDDGPDAAPVLLPGPDGRSAYEIASPGDGSQLVVRRVERTADGLVTTEKQVPLTSPLAGTPAVTPSMLVLPLAKGVLARLTLPLADKPTLEEGPNWRSRRAPPDARGRTTALADGTFLTGDGARGLTHWDWTAARDWKAFPAGKDPREPTRELDNSLTADPVLLPAAKDAPARLCVADAAGVVTLWAVADDGGLKKGRSWNLGRVTAGPYVQRLPGGETRIGCVVNEKQLVWLDPDADKPLWTHPAKPAAELVGRPQVVGGLVVVADESGLIVGLDPATGQAAGPEYHLHGSTAPAAAPVNFGADRLFVPHSDGTVLLPPMSRIH